MATTKNIPTLKINYLSQSDYDDAVLNNSINEDELYFTPYVPITLEGLGGVAATDIYTRSNAGDLDWTTTAEGNQKVIAKSALAFWNGAYSGTSSNLSKCSAGTIIGSNDISTTGEWNKIPKIKSDGVIELGKYVDFHNESGTGDYNARLMVTSTGRLEMSGTTDYAGQSLRNIIISPDTPSGSANNGTIWLQYGNNWIDDAADYVVETGTSGIWTYRKWNNGTAECWGRRAAENYSFTAQSGYGYYTSSHTDLPSGLFTTVIAGFAERAQGTGSTPSNTLITINTNNLTTTLINYFIQSASSGSQSMSISLYVIGTWK